METGKRICEECKRHLQDTELDFVVDPKDADNGWHICPHCRSADSTLHACDVEGCWDEVSCGWPSPEGYRNTCSKHYRKLYKD